MVVRIWRIWAYLYYNIEVMSGTVIRVCERGGRRREEDRDIDCAFACRV